MNSEINPEELALIQKGEKILRTKDLYQVLGISKSAEQKEIKKAYRKVNIILS